MVPVTYYLILSMILLALGLFGIMTNRRNLILILVCIELILLAVNTNFIAFSNYYHDTAGKIFVFFILTVAAAEAAIGLAIVLLFYRNAATINVQDLNHLKG